MDVDTLPKVDSKAEASARSLCVATCLMITAVTMVLPSRPAVVLAIKGDRAAHTMGKMSAAAAVVAGSSGRP